MNDKIWSIIKGAMIATGGAMLAYAAEWLAGHEADLGPALAALAAITIQAARKALEAWRGK